jgi:hypothetical protein
MAYPTTEDVTNVQKKEHQTECKNNNIIKKIVCETLGTRTPNHDLRHGTVLPAIDSDNRALPLQKLLVFAFRNLGDYLLELGPVLYEKKAYLR